MNDTQMLLTDPKHIVPKKTVDATKSIENYDVEITTSQLPNIFKVNIF